MSCRRAFVARSALALAVAVLGCQAVAEPFDRGRLFRIDRTGVPPSYVFGTLHSNDPRVVALPERVLRALADSRHVAFETVLTDRDLDHFFTGAQFDDGRRLADYVDAATFASIRTALGADAPDDAVLERAKPWAVLLMLAQPRSGGGASLDTVLKAEARRAKLSVVGLELVDEQIASLDAIPMPSQVALVHWVLHTQAKRPAELEATTVAWLAGDLARLDALARAPARSDPTLAPHLEALVRHLIVDRTAVMAHRLHLPLARGRVFVAVGALHLHGDRGLLAMLVRAGYRVTRVLRRGSETRSRARMTTVCLRHASRCRASPTCAPSIGARRWTSAT